MRKFSVTQIFWTTHPTLYAYVIYEWPLIDQVNWISMRSFKQSSTPSRISSSIYTPFIIAFMYVKRQKLWQEISHIGTFITKYAQPRFTFWLFWPNHDIVDIEGSSKITLSHWFLPFGVFEFLRRGFCRGGTRYSIGRWIHRCCTGGGSITRGIFLIAADTACSSCQIGTRHQRRVFDLIASIFTCNADQKKLSCLYASILVRKCIGVNQIMSDIVATAKKVNEAIPELRLSPSLRIWKIAKSRKRARIDGKCNRNA